MDLQMRHRRWGERFASVLLAVGFLLTAVVGCDGTDSDVEGGESEPRAEGEATAADEAEKEEPTAEEGDEAPSPPDEEADESARADQPDEDAERAGETAEAPADEEASAPAADESSDRDISDEAIEAYVELHPQIRDIQRALQDELDDAEETDEKEKLQRQAREEIARQLADGGLSSKDFVDIESRVRDDASFREELRERIDQNE